MDEDIELGLEVLKKWDFRADIDSTGAALYEVFKYEANQRLLLAGGLGLEEVGLALGTGYHPLVKPSTEYVTFDSSLLHRLLRNQSSYWMSKYGGGKERLFADCLKAAVTWLRHKLGDHPHDWQWGKLHQTHLPHFFGKKPLLDIIFSAGSHPVPGDNDTPHLSISLPHNLYAAEGWAPTWRHIFDMGDISQSFAVTGPGQCGVLGSPHYDDTIRDSLAGRLHPFIPYSIDQLNSQPAIDGTLLLKPKPQ